MSRNVLVVAEVRNGALRPVSFEALGAANRIAAGGAVTAAILGAAPEGAAQELIARGAGKVVLVAGEQLVTYQPDAYVAALKALYEEQKPDVIILGHTAIGRDLGPRFAGRVLAGMVSDATDVKLDDATGNIVWTRPVYAGKAFVTQVIKESPTVATLRPNNVAALAADGGRSGEVTSVSAPAADLRTVIKEIVRKASKGVDLTSAKVVVSGGRGVKSAEGFGPLYELAEVLGAAVGASRGAADAGYCDYSLQVGQTGKTVTPDLYIACGISGAIQHLAGMSGSKFIVAINKDPEAPIFKVADYGIVGDLFEVVPLLTQEFKKLLA